MRKIPTVFARDRNTKKFLVMDEVNPGCEWVLNGEGIATRKFDGTCVMVKDGKLYKRYAGAREAVVGFIPSDGPYMTDEQQPGWIAIGNGPDDRWHRFAWDNLEDNLPDGTYELVGPLINGNSEQMTDYEFIRHGQWTINDVPRTYVELKDYFRSLPYEGIVWWHPDGRLAKLKRKDFGWK